MALTQCAANHVALHKLVWQTAPGFRQGACRASKARQQKNPVLDPNAGPCTRLSSVAGIGAQLLRIFVGTGALGNLVHGAIVMNYAPHAASLVAVIVDDQRRAAALTRVIAAQVGNPQREVLSWQRTQPENAGVVAMDRSGNYISQLLVGLLVAAGILNTLLMSVLERTREFGVMMALGMAPRTLFRLVITESLWLALLGLVLGVIITAPWFLYLVYVGIDFSAAIGQDYSAGGVLVDPVLRIRLYRESALAILSGVFALTLLSGLYPAWRAARVPPVQSLKAL